VRPVRVAVVGTGLVGASLAGALRRLDVVDEVVGADTDPGALDEALRRRGTRCARRRSP
jgi:prephenate dehydrogenase